MIRIAICDDKPGYIKMLTDYIKRWEAKRRIRVSISSFTSGWFMLEEIKEKGAFDIVFLDIQLDHEDETKSENGLDVARELNALHMDILVIFVSSFNYFKDAYDVHPFHFLSKPFDDEKLMKVLDEAVEVKNASMESYSFEYNRKRYSLLLKEIEYFFSERRVIRIKTIDSNYQYYYKLNDVEAELEMKSTPFIRVHKSYLVNMQQIKVFQATEVVLRSNEVIPISVDRRASVRRAHMKLLESE